MLTTADVAWLTTLRDIVDVLTPLLVTIVGAILAKKSGRIKAVTDKTHTLVNGRLDQALKDIAQIKADADFPDRRATDHLPPVNPPTAPTNPTTSDPPPSVTPPDTTTHDAPPS